MILIFRKLKIINQRKLESEYFIFLNQECIFASCNILPQRNTCRYYCNRTIVDAILSVNRSSVQQGGKTSFRMKFSFQRWISASSPGPSCLARYSSTCYRYSSICWYSCRLIHNLWTIIMHKESGIDGLLVTESLPWFQDYHYFFMSDKPLHSNPMHLDVARRGINTMSARI